MKALMIIIKLAFHKLVFLYSDNLIMKLEKVYVQIPLDPPSNLLVQSLQKQMGIFLFNEHLEPDFPSQLHTTVCYLGGAAWQDIQDLAKRIAQTIRLHKDAAENHTLHKIGYRHSFVNGELYFLLQSHNVAHAVSSIAYQIHGVITNPHVTLFSLGQSSFCHVDQSTIISDKLKSIRDRDFERPYKLQPDFSRLQVIGTCAGKKYRLQEIDLYTGQINKERLPLESKII